MTYYVSFEDGKFTFNNDRGVSFWVEEGIFLDTIKYLEKENKDVSFQFSDKALEYLEGNYGIPIKYLLVLGGLYFIAIIILIKLLF
jgi:hypothetical protein